MLITHSAKFSLRPLTLIVSALLATGVAAQEPDKGEIEKITVTTQKRVQAIQDVPVSISAYNGDFLERLGVNELDALSDITPGLVIQEQSPNNPGFVIRGITSDSGSSQSSPRVSIYYNGADVSRSRGSYFELFDIERVEVVKGPQATLFGTAASVGALSVITNKPEEDFSAKINAAVGNFGATSLHGYVTGGNATLQGRLAVSYRKRDGFIENIAGDADSQTSNGTKQDDMHAIDRQAVRASLRFVPNDKLTGDIVYTHEKNADSGTSFKNANYAPTGGDTSPYTYVEMSGSPYSKAVLGAEKLGVDRTVDDVNLTLNYTLSDSTTLTSISAFRRFDSIEVFDADGTQAWFLEFAEDAQGDQFSQELRLVNVQDKLTSIAGVSYFTEDGSQRVPFSTEESIFLNCVGALSALGQPCINADGSVNVLSAVLTAGAFSEIPYSSEFTNYGDNKSYSAFADFTYLVSDALELTAGLRYVKEDKESAYMAVIPDSVLTGGTFFGSNTDGETFSANQSYRDWLPRFNALYRISPDLNIYATLSKGRRSNVLDVTGSTVSDVPAEIIWNYEAGIKGQAWQRKLDYSASVFYQDYTHFQVTLLGDDGIAYQADAGSATNIGVEGELRTIVGEGLQLFANFAYIDATIDDDATNGNLAGNRFRLQPERTFSLGGSYFTAVSNDFNFTSSAIFSYRSDVFFEAANQPNISEDAVSLANLRVGIERADASWSVNLVASNIFDKEYLVDAGNTGGAFGNPTFVAGPPRFYGIEFSMNFGG
ncbi:TonB-dependent receptor [Flavobacterium sp. W21_SRS_FM6]|uniref:TonB-dependent receptor n=1 Tax=Flavobacterium sp. W21_SRS_FM6 TaxID=3240268 RepID=UPI003F924BC0